MAVEMLYEDGLPARMRAREQFAALEEQIRDVDRWAKSDDEFYAVTGDLTRQLGEARSTECASSSDACLDESRACARTAPKARRPDSPETCDGIDVPDWRALIPLPNTPIATTQQSHH